MISAIGISHNRAGGFTFVLIRIFYYTQKKKKDGKQQNDGVLAKHESRLPYPTTSSSTAIMAETLQQKPQISAHYQTRAAHHGVVTRDWLDQAQAAVGRRADEAVSEDSSSLKSAESEKAFSVIDEFNNWRKQPELAEAVVAIGALASVIRSSEANTMMELEIELKKASDSLKVTSFLSLLYCFQLLE